MHEFTHLIGQMCALISRYLCKEVCLVYSVTNHRAAIFLCEDSGQCFCPAHDLNKIQEKKLEKQKSVANYSISTFIPGTKIVFTWDGVSYAGIVSEILEEQCSCFVDCEYEEDETCKLIVPWSSIKVLTL